MLVFWKGPAAALTHRYTCPSSEAPAEHRQVGLGLSGSSLHFGIRCCSLKSVYTDGECRMALPCSLVPREGCSCPHCSRSPQKSKQSPLLCFCQILAFTLSDLWAHLGCGAPVFLSQAYQLSFKIPNVRDLAQQSHTDPLWESLAAPWPLLPVYPRRTVAQTRTDLEFMVSRKLGSS